MTQISTTDGAPAPPPWAASLRTAHLLMDTSLLVGLGGHSLLPADGSSSASPSSALIGEQLCDWATLSGGDGRYESKKRPRPNEDHLSRRWTQRGGEGGGAARVGGLISRSVVTSSWLATAAHVKVKDRPSPHKDREVGLFTGLCGDHDCPVHQLQMLAAFLPASKAWTLSRCTQVPPNTSLPWTGVS